MTGANGYIAVWVVKTFLDQGFSVRGTVRSESKAGHLRKLFKDFGDKFEVVVVEDITKVRTHSGPSCLNSTRFSWSLVKELPTRV